MFYPLYAKTITASYGLAPMSWAMYIGVKLVYVV